MHVDLLVIGGGTGGIVSALLGAERGAYTVMVQDGPIGGDCTFTGCVPSKALLAAAAAGRPFDEAIKHVHASVEHIAATEDADRMRRDGVEVLEGRAVFTGPKQVSISGARTVSADRVIIATGSRPALPPIPGLADIPHLTNETVFKLAAAPGSMAVLGGGPIGCEMAQAMQRLGVESTVVEMVDRVLPRDEQEASQVVAAALTREGVTLRTGRRATRVEAGPTVLLDDGSSVSGDMLLVATGRRPDTDGLALDAAGVDTDEHGWIATSTDLSTSADGVYAVGDITGRPAFTHAAAHMGLIAVTNALAKGVSRLKKMVWNDNDIPWVTFTSPEVAHIGLTVEAAREVKGAKQAYVPFTEVDRAVTEGATEGYVRLIAGPRRGLGSLGGGRVLGATVVGARAGELIAEIGLAMRTGAFVGRLAQNVHAYPTWSIAVQQAAAQFFTRVGGREAVSL